MESAKLLAVTLRHILDAINKVLEVTSGLQPETIVEDFRVAWIVERGILLISEAAKALPPEIRAEEPDMPWQDIISIGNYLRHEYYRIKPKVMQQIVLEHLPRLRPAHRAPAHQAWKSVGP